MPITLALRCAFRAILAGLSARRTLLPALTLFVPTTIHTQPRNCPGLARVPGYGACANVGGRSCGFCTYRCNGETLVSWNVCGK